MILLSGVKPTGRTHIGNYFGAMRQWKDMEESTKYDCFFMIADYHTLNFVQSAVAMRQLTLDMALDYLAIGLDPKKVILFKQSDVSAHTELTWIFNTLVTVPYLMRGHAYKDAETQSKEISVGTFDYPVLMASDILLYDTDIVPVGQDQKQHIEYARDIAGKFNNVYGDTFKHPEPFIVKDVAVVPGIDGRKMSKSYGNTIPLFAEYDEIQERVMAIVTDNGLDFPQNVYTIHRLLKSEGELKPLYEANKGRYKALKEALIEDLEVFIAPLRARRKALAEDEVAIWKILEEGARKAREIADKKMGEVKNKIGVKIN